MTEQKPTVKLTGHDSSVFNLIGVCTIALNQAGKSAEAKELSERMWECSSYHEALTLMGEYVDIE